MYLFLGFFLAEFLTRRSCWLTDRVEDRSFFLFRLPSAHGVNYNRKYESRGYSKISCRREYILTFFGNIFSIKDISRLRFRRNGNDLGSSAKYNSACPTVPASG